jgi:hypothetical protein
MKTFEYVMGVDASWYVTVDAETEEEAYEKASSMYPRVCELIINEVYNIELDNEEEDEEELE